MSKPVTCIIVGAGHRAVGYAAYSKENPDKMQIVGVADPLEYRRKQVAKEYNLTEDQCFESAEQLAARPKFADAVINGTMDTQHVDTSLPLLEAGYDMLLEKPFAVNEKEMFELTAAARKFKRKVLICHVLRYTPFYAAIRKKILEGAVGEIMNIQTLEHVSFHHMAVAFIRGKWKCPQACGSPFIMSKCCHDMDILMWMNSGIRPTAVGSFGNQMYFNEAHAPKNSGTRCMKDCPIESECIYSARKMYVDKDIWRMYAWQDVEHRQPMTKEEEIAHMANDSDFGKCVWKSGCNVVDHQSVVIEFENGSTATHNLVGGTARPAREINILGTKGEIQGVFEDSRFVIRTGDLQTGEGENLYSEECFDLKVDGSFDGSGGGHGGGDGRLVEDFVNHLQGKPASISCTSIEDSVYGHLVGFKSEQARVERRIIEIPKV